MKSRVSRKMLIPGLLVLGLVATLGLGVRRSAPAAEPQPAPAAVPTLPDQPEACSAAQLREMLKSGKPPDLVFVGSRDFFEQRRIPGASCVGYADLAEFFPPESRDRDIVLYCGCCAGSSEGISGAAVRLLQSRGFLRVRHLGGHFAAWQDAGFPVEGTNPGTANPERAWSTTAQKDRLERFVALQDARRRELDLALRAEPDDERRRRIHADLEWLDREGELGALKLKRAIALENGDRSKVEEIDRMLGRRESP